MKYKEYIRTHQVFSAEDVYSLTTHSSARTLLHRSLKSGEIERVRRCIYVSKTGKFFGETPDPFRVVSAIDNNAILSNHSALLAHGVSHTVFFECTFRSQLILSPFEYGGIRYIPLKYDDNPLTQTIHANAYGSVLVTTREQTLVDCLSRPRQSGGLEEILRSCSAFPYLDIDILLSLLRMAPVTVVARTGWLLEKKSASWNVSDFQLGQLEKLLGRGPTKLDPGACTTCGWNSHWKLYLPTEERELISWLT